MTDLTIRPLTDATELDLFQKLDYVLDHELAEDLAARRRRPGWLWVATRGDRLLARAGWWGTADAQRPSSFDFLDVDDSLPVDEAIAIGTRLVAAALAELVPDGAVPPQYGRFIPADWRTDAQAKRAIETRFAVLERLGARQLVERLRLEWRAGTPLPRPKGRLTFRAVADRQELIELMVPVLENTLDAHSRAELALDPPEVVAARHFDEEFAHFTSPRDWWRVATSASGEPVGFVVPARNVYNAIIAYIGVLPAHRGHGYVDEILAEGTRILAGQEVPRIRAATDVPNVPMARAFERAGYVNFERSVNFVWGG